ncbi:MAG: ethanolamine utilization protein EutH [Clostridiales bacterium]|nr:ethanolamine utilization protein EutH [Clostridiales bacterium]
MQTVIMWIMAAGALIGGVDRIFGNKPKLGEKFEEGFHLLGPIALSQAGMLCIEPILSGNLSKVITPVYTMLGLDPGMFGSILPLDMGGFPMAKSMAADPLIGAYSGIVVAAIFGCTIIFTVPVGMGMLAGMNEERNDFARGMLFGLIAMPIALVIGGLISGLGLITTLWQLLPVLLLSVLLLFGIWKKTDFTIKAFTVFAEGIKILITIGLILGAVHHLTGLEILPGLLPLQDAMAVVSSIGIVLLGSLPVAEIMQRLLKTPFKVIGKKIGLNPVSMAGLIISPVSVLPTIAMMKDMDKRGRIANAAAAVCSASAIAAHLGFTASQEPSMLAPMLISKLLGGLIGASIAIYVTRKERTGVEI